MAYLGNTLQVAFPSYRNIDDISGSFNGVTTTFPLRVSGVAPVPFPINSNQCLISVGGVIQRPDDSGTEGFRISGTDIIFSSAPAGAADFFGVILAGADYVNVGANFPSGSATVPSITFDSDLDTGIYNPNPNELGFTTAGTARLILDSNGQLRVNSLGSAAAPVITFNSDPNTGIYSPGADQVAISTNGTGRLFVGSTGNVGVGTASPGGKLVISDGSTTFQFDPVGGTGNILRSLTSGGSRDALLFDASQYVYSNGATEYARIDTSGRLGLGTSSPSTYGAQLAVIGGSVHADRNIGGGSAQVQLSMGASSGANFGQIGNTGTRWSLGYGTTANTIGTEVLVWNSSGQVGIGTTTPGSYSSAANQLVVGAASGNQGLTIASGSGSYGSLYFADGTTGADAYRGIVGYNHSDNSLIFGTDGTEKARIDSSGRLLVGTSTSTHNISNQSKLAIVVTGYLNRGGLDITGYTGGGSTGASAEINLNRSVGTTDGSVTGLSAFPWSLGAIRFNGANGSGFGAGAEIRGIADSSVYTTSNSPAYLSFATTQVGASSPTERMKISSGGNVSITGNQAGASKLYVQNWAGTATDQCIYTDLQSGSNSATAYHLLSITQGVGAWALTGNGTSTFSSDERKKKNIEATRDGYLEDLCKLRVVKYNWKADEDGTPKELGLIAQEVEQVFPGLIAEGIRLDGDDFDIKFIKGSVIPFMLLKALQEAAAKIETLEAKVNALEGN